MYLLLNLSEKDIVYLALFDERNYQEKKYAGQNRELLKCVDLLFKNLKFKIKNLKGIMCVVGAGGFTSTRVAAVIANTLAYTLQIPVLAITVAQLFLSYDKHPFDEQTGQSNSVQKLIPKLLKQPIGQYISPTYSGEPNIGKKKK